MVDPVDGEEDGGPILGTDPRLAAKERAMQRTVLNEQLIDAEDVSLVDDPVAAEEKVSCSAPFLPAFFLSYFHHLTIIYDFIASLLCCSSLSTNVRYSLVYECAHPECYFVTLKNYCNISAFFPAYSLLSRGLFYPGRDGKARRWHYHRAFQLESRTRRRIL